MRTIYKYTIPIEDTFTISIPRDHDFLCVQMQNNLPQLWMLVNSKSPYYNHTFHVIGTGHPADHVDYNMYIGTFQLPDLGLVFHLFG